MNFEFYCNWWTLNCIVTDELWIELWLMNFELYCNWWYFELYCNRWYFELHCNWWYFELLMMLSCKKKWRYLKILRIVIPSIVASTISLCWNVLLHFYIKNVSDVKFLLFLVLYEIKHRSSYPLSAAPITIFPEDPMLNRSNTFHWATTVTITTITT